MYPRIKSQNGKHWGLLYISLAMHVLWAATFVGLVFFRPYDPQPPATETSTWLAFLISSLQSCGPCDSAADAINNARQMDRFDLLGVGLTVLSIILAVGAFGGYFLIKGAAKDAAAEEAIEWLGNNMEKLISDEALKRAVLSDRIMLTLATQVKNRIDSEDTMDSAIADQIASAFNGNQ